MGHSFLFISVALLTGQVEPTPIIELPSQPSSLQTFSSERRTVSAPVVSQPQEPTQGYVENFPNFDDATSLTPLSPKLGCDCQKKGRQGLGLRQRVLGWWSSPSSDATRQESRPAMLGRMRNWFRGDDPEPYGNYSGMQQTHSIQSMPAVHDGAWKHMPVSHSEVIATTAEPPLLDGTSRKATPKTTQAVFTTSPSSDSGVVQIEFRPVSASAASAPKARLSAGAAPERAIQARFVEKVGHEHDFSWITGQLVRTANGWAILYATPETIDTYNGRLILQSSVPMTHVGDGDLVCVLGTLAQQSGSTVYHARAVHLIERK